MSTDFPKSQPGDPTWEIAALFPAQGQWTAADYLKLNTNRLIELDKGQLELLAMPTELHQLIAFYLCAALRAPVAGKPRGLALMLPFRIRVSESSFREPDVMFMLNQHLHRRHSKYWEGADLVIEVVSEDDPNRDLHTKRLEYAQAGISEYWIVDPRERSIRVLTLDAGATHYREASCSKDGEMACSVLLSEFAVDVSGVFDHPMTNPRITT